VAQLYTADPDTEMARVSIPITKAEQQDDGSVLVWGLATDGALDRDQQIIDPGFAKKSLQSWFASGANVRVMHSASLYPAGKGIELVSRDDGEWLKAEISEPTAVRLVNKGVLQAYSVGIAKPRIIRDAVAKGGRVVDGETVEVSLVDRPANPSCRVTLAKMADDLVDLTGQEVQDLDKAVTVNPSDVADMLRRLGHANGAVEKRDYDKGVGGGTDRDKIPEKDFAGPNRSYPIVSPKDVSDAASLAGKADDPAAVRRRIKAIARRKGPEFEAKIPDSWKDGDDSDNKKVADADMAKPQDNDSDDDDDKPDQTPKDDDQDDDKDPDDYGDGGAKPTRKSASADQTVEAGLEDIKDAIREAIGAQQRDPDRDSHAADRQVTADLEALDEDVDRAIADQRQDEREDAEAHKAAQPDHLDLTGSAAPMVNPADGVSYGMRRLHDAVCGAYDWVTVKSAYPGLEQTSLGELVDNAPTLLHGALSQAYNTITDQAGSVEMAERIAGLAKAYSTAAAIGEHGEDELAQARRELHKAFRSANPDAPHLTPVATGEGGKQPHPEQFRRAFLSAGRAPQTATGSSPRIPTPTHTISAEQFRGDHGSGGATPSRGGRSQSSTAPGEKGVEADLVKTLATLHNHVSDAHPHICPMGPYHLEWAEQPKPSTDTQDNHADDGPQAVHAAATAELFKHASPDVLKTAVADLVNEQIQTKLSEQAQVYEAELTKMRSQLDELSAQPDPRQAPWRGMAGLEQVLPELTKNAQEPPEGATAEKISRTARWLSSPDPQQREAAREALQKLIQR